jgi:ribonucleoside-diphosphate reductase alpha chain
VNCPRDISFEAFKSVYMRAYELDCKGCTTWRPNEITGAILSVDEPKRAAPAAAPIAAAAAPEVLPPVVPAARPRPPASDGGVVYMTKPLDRPEALPGTTYKLRWPESDHAIYITMNDILEGGRRRPFEIFINSKNMEHYAWTVALTRMISAVFRRGGDVAFVVEELKAVFDPRGGQWMNRQYVPSLLAAIGGVIEEHMVAIGFLGPRPAPVSEVARKVAGLEGEILEAPQAPTAAGGDSTVASGGRATTGQGFKFCPRCSNPSFIRIEGCDTCMNCGYSRCS